MEKKLQITKILDNVDMKNFIEEQRKKGVEVSETISSNLRKKLEEELSMAKFDAVDNIDKKFSEFLNYEGARLRLKELLDSADKLSAGDEIGKQISKVIEDLNESSEVMVSGTSVARKAGGIISSIIRLFTTSPKSLTEAFKEGLDGLDGQVQQLEHLIKVEQNKAKQAIKLLKTHLPEIAADVIKIEYLDKVLEKIIKENELNKDSKEFIVSYRVSLASMKQVNSMSLLRILMRLSRNVKAKTRLNKTENKLISNLGTLVLESLLNTIEASNNKVSDSIDGLIENLDKSNEEQDKKNRENELANGRKYIEQLKGFESKLIAIKSDYEKYSNEKEKMIEESSEFLGVYNISYDKNKKFRNELLESGKAEFDIIDKFNKDKIFDEDAVVKEIETIKSETQKIDEEETKILD